MNRGATIFLQAVIVLFGIGALALLLWEPQVEGRNAHATQFQIYFKDPFLVYAYTGSIAFFVALYQAFRLLGYIGQNRVFSVESVKALRTIKSCALTLVAFLVGAEIYLLVFVRGSDDIAGGVAMGLLLILGCAAVGTGAAILERMLERVVELKPKTP
jgi:hypothetical protein